MAGCLAVNRQVAAPSSDGRINIGKSPGKSPSICGFGCQAQSAAGVNYSASKRNGGVDGVR